MLERKGDLYSATLGLVDVVKGTNSFYKLQVLESDAGHRFVFLANLGLQDVLLCSSRILQLA